ncbi:Uncharacterised protein [uncultured archaeon]|nr:Uncharacterised protein [uncultured archaeon]
MTVNETEMNKTKNSYGVIICRKNQTTGEIEALLIQRRYTYAFFDFVHGRYSNNFYSVKRLLSNMTDDEIELVRSLNFDVMFKLFWWQGKEN